MVRPMSSVRRTLWGSLQRRRDRQCVLQASGLAFPCLRVHLRWERLVERDARIRLLGLDAQRVVLFLRTSQTCKGDSELH
jgi:hypothetical protein